MKEKMFNTQKSFEKSLRSSSGTYQVPIITPLKTEIHKGCTGKAHACGSIKSTNTVLANKSTTPVKPKAKNDNTNKTLRKNSLSSETVSDSGSESWNSNKDNSSGSNSVTQIPPKPLKRTKSVNYGSHAGNNTVSVRRRTSDSVISADVTDNAKSPTKTQRGRLMSDGDGKTDGSDEISRLRRSSSFRSKNIPPLIPPKPKINTQQQQSPQQNSPAFKPNGNFINGRLRNSFRGLKSQNQMANWNTLWENSFSIKLGGGNFRVLDKNALSLAVAEKVNYN